MTVAAARVAEYVADLKDLIDFAVTRKQGFEVDELGEDGPESPHVDGLL